MKKMFLALGVALFASITATAQEDDLTDFKEIQEDIRGRSCLGGLGICLDPQKTTDGQTANKSAPMKTIKVIRVTGNVLVIEVDVNTLSIEEQIVLFGKEFSSLNANETFVFIQNDDYVFEKDMLLYLEIDPRFSLLRQGNYPLEVIDGKVLVTLTLAEF